MTTIKRKRNTLFKCTVRNVTETPLGWHQEIKEGCLYLDVGPKREGYRNSSDQVRGSMDRYFLVPGRALTEVTSEL